MTLIVIIDEKENQQDTIENLDFDHNNANQVSWTGVEMDSNVSILYRSPNKSVKGLKPDYVILRCEVEQEFYDKYIKKMVGGHGVVIDER